MENSYEKRMHQIEDWLKEIGSGVKEKLNTLFWVEEKSGKDDLVSEVDKWCEKEIVERIKQNYPNDHILGEEGSGDVVQARNGNVWMIDPIDGTTNFIKLKENFGIMVAYFEDGVGKVACIYQPVEDIMLCGAKDCGVKRNQVQLNSVKDIKLSQGLIDISRKLIVSSDEWYKDIVNEAIALRMFGCSAQSIRYVCEGKIAGYINRLCPWDYAPALVFGKELGFDVTNINGEPLNLQERELCIIAPPNVYKKIMEKKKI